MFSMLITLDASRDPQVKQTLVSYRQLSHERLYEEHPLLAREQPAESSSMFWATVQAGSTPTAIHGEDNVTVTAQ